MISCNSLSFSYPKTALFDSFSWNVPTGSVCGLLGRNGAGKTTLLKLLSGLMFPKTGTIDIDGHAPRKRTVDFLADLAFLGQEPPSLPFTLEKYRELAGPLYPRFDTALFDALCARFCVDRNKRFDKFSLGDRKKAWLCFLLACRARVILLDEPSAGLDIPAQETLRQVVTEAMGDDTTIVISTHHVRELQDLVDRVTIIDEGKLVLDGSIDEIGKKYRVAHSLDRAGFGGKELSARRVPSGWEAIIPNTDGVDSPLNLELLFTALVGNEDDPLVADSRKRGKS